MQNPYQPTLFKIPVIEGDIDMGAQENIHLNEPKNVPKQIPLFEEEDDGNLVPYRNEE